MGKCNYCIIYLINNCRYSYSHPLHSTSTMTTVITTVTGFVCGVRVVKSLSKHLGSEQAKISSCPRERRKWNIVSKSYKLEGCWIGAALECLIKIPILVPKFITYWFYKIVWIKLWIKSRTVTCINCKKIYWPQKRVYRAGAIWTACFMFRHKEKQMTICNLS